MEIDYSQSMMINYKIFSKDIDELYNIEMEIDDEYLEGKKTFYDFIKSHFTLQFAMEIYRDIFSINYLKLRQLDFLFKVKFPLEEIDFMKSKLSTELMKNITFDYHINEEENSIGKLEPCYNIVMTLPLNLPKEEDKIKTSTNEE